MEIKITQVESTLEKRIITGMIVSTDFLSDLQDMFNIEYIQNRYARTVAMWCADYFDNYNKAPFTDIQNIFDAHRAKLESEEAELISDLLKEISDRYKQQEMNTDYLYDQTTEYFLKRELEIMNGNIGILLSQGDIKAAEKEVLEFHRISKVASKWINPMTTEGVEIAFKQGVSINNFKKDLGKFISTVSRGWLIGIMGPFKRGKTWFADEWALSGMFGFRKVVKFSLEMNEAQNRGRIYRRLTAFPDEGQLVIIPVFDCAHNQYGRCKKTERAGNIPLVASENEKLPRFDPKAKINDVYQHCSACREYDREDYQFSIWYKVINTKAKDYKDWFDEYSVKDRLKAYEEMYKHYYRLRCYPRFTANVTDILRDLDVLERKEGFIPDLVEVDMVDILAPERKGLAGVEKEDESWMALARLASERNCVVITPTQVTREAQEADTLSSKHAAKWIGKLGHIDAMYTINQSLIEKQMGFARIGCIEHRHMKFGDNQCFVTQNLDIGQFCLDSWIN